ncbi:hypothetical protein NLJ89_g10874 [Agrocybe chaxingu]|uniref:Uncharacterized protein n=1 Tax=Agrocybe chaxingu TaxID=84603 RepID=A0A9W8JQZ9_9AGAR|nr:hypothetical protein NLJ89_g10874 [Agrocybe chaxingu]
MWVKGDLKDQLGISHRKDKKNKKISDSNLEAAPMFQDQHNRSMSEFSNPPNGYEPAMDRSPAVNDTPRATYLDTPPMSEAVDLPPREAVVQYATVRNDPMDGTRLSPFPPDGRPTHAPSPQPSYYSASDLPPASPLPSPKFKLPNGEVTTPSHPGPQRSNSLLVPQPQPYPRSPIESNAYEMRVRTPPNEDAYGGYYGHDPRAPSAASQASYATAVDEFWTAEDDGGNSPRHPTGQRPPPQGGLHHQPQQQQYLVDDSDQETIMDPRRVSNMTMSTWEGGRAL